MDRDPAALDRDGWPEALAACEPPVAVCAHVTGHPGQPDHPCVAGWSPAPFARAEVERVLALERGAPHHRPWLAVLALRGGRVALVRAWCCGAGWSCHQGGSVEVARDLPTLVRAALTADEAARLGLLLG